MQPYTLIRSIHDFTRIDNIDKSEFEQVWERVEKGYWYYKKKRYTIILNEFNEIRSYEINRHRETN